jgi:hypothetical protein
MTQVTRKELVDNVLRPALEKNDKFEDALMEIMLRMHAMYPEVAEGMVNAAKETKAKYGN